MGLFSKSNLERIQSRENTPKSHTIMLVDDEANNLRSISRILDSEYDIVTAVDGQEALDFIRNDPNPERIHLIISDQRMPNLSGVDFLHQTVAIIPHTIRMILTGFIDVDSIIGSINEGRIYKFITKPVEPTDLLVTVKRGLEAFDLEHRNMRLITELKTLNAELEVKVEERTRDIQAAMEDLHQAQDQLVESEKMAALGSLVAGVAHEINTPVGVSVTAATRLQRDTAEFSRLYAENAMTRKALADFLSSAETGCEIITSNLKRAAELVQSFKQVAVDQSSELERTFAIGDYLREIVTSLQPELKRLSHGVRIECADDLTVTGCPGVYSQIFTNLIMNSLIHGLPGDREGKISISVKVDDDAIGYVYRDNGRGIPDENLKKVFEPFFTTNRQDGGSGLGMHIIYNLVTRKLNGTIRCDSTVGEGVEFVMVIPGRTADTANGSE